MIPFHAFFGWLNSRADEIGVWELQCYREKMRSWLRPTDDGDDDDCVLFADGKESVSVDHLNPQ